MSIFINEPSSIISLLWPYRHHNIGIQTINEVGNLKLV